MLKNEADGQEVEAMAGFAGREAADDRAAEKGQVAGEVQELMPDEFVREAERPVQNVGIVQDHGVLE